MRRETVKTVPNQSPGRGTAMNRGVNKIKGNQHITMLVGNGRRVGVVGGQRYDRFAALARRNIGRHQPPVGNVSGQAVSIYSGPAQSDGRAGMTMEAQQIAIDAVIVLTGCDRETITRLIRRLYLSGVKDPKRLTFKGLQFAAEAIT